MASFRPVLLPTKHIRNRACVVTCARITVTARSFATVKSTTLPSQDEKSADIIIVGSGAAGLAAALRAKSQGLKPLLVEKTAFVGGCSGYSGGGLWIPNSGVYPTSANITDSKEEALKYLENLIPKEVGPASSRARKIAFLDNGPKMVEFLKSQGFEWIPAESYPDYYPDVPGGKVDGRAIEGAVFDLNRLGENKPKLIVPMSRVAMHTFEAKHVTRAGRTLKSLQLAAKVVAGRGLFGKMVGKHNVGLGQSLTGQLYLMNLKAKNDIWLNTKMTEIIVDDGVVRGIVVEKDGRTLRLEASRGVLLAAGGFAHNAAMRKKYQQAPVTGTWSSTPKQDQGDAHNAAMAIGVEMANMHRAWWGPSLHNPKTGETFFELFSRSLPHSMIVDSTGQRFTNESQGYVGFGDDQLKRHKAVSAIPAFQIMDARHRKSYMLGMQLPGQTTKKSIEDGLVFKADTLTELAQKMGVDPEGLEKQVTRFNAMVATGVDSEFGRGSNAYDRNFGDPAAAYAKNPSLGTIEKGPFYGVHIYPGDLGTSGGILTDEHARALRKDGTVVEGLYAAGNSSASVMGGWYPGPGSTLGPALTFGFVATNHMISKEVSDRVNQGVYGHEEARQQPAAAAAAAA